MVRLHVGGRMVSQIARAMKKPLALKLPANVATKKSRLLGREARAGGG
jgi:hypothetical protein